MGRKKLNKSLIQQVKETLDSKLAIGQSKYAAKLDGTYTQYIYSWDTYRSYLKHCCYFVKWCKEQPIDPVLHKMGTGVSNEVILQNLERLRRSGKQIIVRTPVIPGFNEGIECEKIKRYCDKLDLPVEFLSYHTFGEDKKNALNAAPYGL